MSSFSPSHGSNHTSFIQVAPDLPSLCLLLSPLNFSTTSVHSSDLPLHNATVLYIIFSLARFYTVRSQKLCPIFRTYVYLGHTYIYIYVCPFSELIQFSSDGKEEELQFQNPLPRFGCRQRRSSIKESRDWRSW